MCWHGLEVQEVTVLLLLLFGGAKEGCYAADCCIREVVSGSVCGGECF